MTRSPTFSVVIETANVASDDPLLRRSIASIAAQGALLAEANEIVLLCEAGAPAENLRALARDHPSLRFETAPNPGYGGMKAHAARVTTGDVIVFADSDCVYAAGWLEALLEPLSDSNVQGVAGETAIPVRGPYSLAVAATFNFPGFSGDRTGVPSPRYWANNVALRRDALESLVAPEELSRGACVLHAEALASAGSVVIRNPRARAHHAVIAPRDFRRRYLDLGRDNAALERARDGGERAPAFPPDRDGDRPLVRVARRVGRAVARRPARIVLVPLAIPVIAAAATLHELGRRLPPRPVQRDAR